MQITLLACTHMQLDGSNIDKTSVFIWTHYLAWVLSKKSLMVGNCTLPKLSGCCEIQYNADSDTSETLVSGIAAAMYGAGPVELAPMRKRDVGDRPL
jgi:hypothetical protein